MDSSVAVAIVAAAGTITASVVGAWIVSIFSRRKTDAEIGALQEQLSQSKEKSKREAEDWVTARYRELAEKNEERVKNLEKEMANLKIEIRNKEDALEYLMDQVRPDFPVAVFVAGEIATGKRKRPLNSIDINEEH